MIKAVIFDVDGLLVDSEPLWQEAETIVFSSVGVPITKETAAETTGLRTDETVRYWYEKYPWSAPTITEVEAQVNSTVLELIKRNAAPKEGAMEVIARCRKLALPIGVASSSSQGIIAAVIDKLGIRAFIDVILSAEDEPHGKPDPAVYVHAASKLGVDPRWCLAFEDSLTGVQAAKAANMYCIAVPDQLSADDPGFTIADRVVDSLAGVTDAMIQAPERLRGSVLR